MSRWVLSLVAVVAALACRRAEIDIPNPPASATHMGVLVHATDGRRIASTPLFSVAEGPPSLDLEQGLDDDALVEVVAYTALDPRADAARLTQSPLARADEADPLLAAPTFAWTRRLGDETYADLADPTSLELTTPALAPCPQRLPAGMPAHVDLSCFSATCTALARQSDCRVELDAAECGMTVDVAVDARGRILGACDERPDGPPLADLSITCGECNVDFYAGPFEPLASVTTRAVVDVDELALWQPTPIAGHLAGLAVLEDRVVVVATDGPARDVTECDARVVSRFEFLDPTTLETIGTATTPYCVADLVAYEGDSSPGFIAVHNGNSPELTRFDAEGRAVERLALFPDEPSLSHRPVWMVRNGRDLVILLPRLRSFGGLRGFRLATVAVDPLRVTATSREDDEVMRPTGLAPIRDGIVAIGDLSNNGVFVYRTDGTGALDSFTGTRASLGGASQRVEFVSYNEVADRFVASVQARPNPDRRWGGTHVLEPTSAPDGVATPFAKTFERRTDASASLPMPGGVPHTLVMLTDLDGMAYVGVVDVRAVRFLPGMVPVHPADRPLGPASTMLWGEEKVAYAVHPASGHVTRIALP